MKQFKPGELFKGVEDAEQLKALPNEYLFQRVILGIDIYKYSQYPLIEQIYIPVLFEALYTATVKNVILLEPFFFSAYGLEVSDFKKKFISTGDGGFQIFDNPIEAIIFALYFQTNVKRFVSGSNKVEYAKKLHKIIDNIELRYAITSDLVYSFNSNFFGPGIINNARILSKDNLNRLLIDASTMSWFTNNINSVENLMHIKKPSFILTNAFKDYDTRLETLLFDPQDCFKSVDVLKIGSITVKNRLLNIYNLHIQAVMNLTTDKHAYTDYVITLGNLNTAGIE